MSLFFWKSQLGLSLKGPSKQTPAKPGKPQIFFLPNFQGILVRPIGVVWSTKIVFGGPLAAGKNLLGKRRKTVTSENLDFPP